MSHDTAQEALIEVTGVITRLLPCPEHAPLADGQQTVDGAGRAMQNPNGYRHDCAACAATPTHQEPLEA